MRLAPGAYALVGLVGTSVAVGAPAPDSEANDDLQAEVIKCGAIADNRQRIACYDRIARLAADAAQETHRRLSNEQDEMSNEQDETPSQERTASSTSAVPEASTVEARPPADPNRAIDAFGAEKLRHSGGEAVDRVVAEIAVVRKLSRGNFQLTLDNGQKWREIEYDKYTRYAVGDMVEIRRGRLGTYDLFSRKTGHRNKVRRIE